MAEQTAAQGASTSLVGVIMGSDSDYSVMADAVQADRGMVNRLIAEHAELAEAIGRRDVNAFDSQLLSHLESTYRVVLR